LRPSAEVPAFNADDPKVGKRLSRRYELRRIVADGGMGRVYEGIDHASNGRIAVKILHADVALDPIALERFKREYEISRELRHPHIVSVFDFANEDGAWFLVMEYLDGEELRLILDRKEKLAPSRLLRAMSQAALALDAAHARQYVHRDLKPDNLFLCGGRDGDVLKILDFGSVRDNNKHSKKLTVVGTTLGSPYYMSPEQAQGLDTLDACADIFSLAAMVYECVVGKVPFEGVNAPQILMKILSADPKAPSVVLPAGAVPPGLDGVLLEQGMAKNPRHRAQTAGEFANALLGAWALDLNFRQVAEMPLPALDQALAAAAARIPAARGPSVAVEASRDPFASADPFAARGPVPARAPQPVQSARVPQPIPSAPSSAERRLDQAFAQAGAEPDYGVVPAPRPPWVIPAVLGSVFAVVLAIVLVVALR
jgi:serine/threonine-protein kinase